MPRRSDNFASRAVVGPSQSMARTAASITETALAEAGSSIEGDSRHDDVGVFAPRKGKRPLRELEAADEILPERERHVRTRDVQGPASVSIPTEKTRTPARSSNRVTRDGKWNSELIART